MLHMLVRSFGLSAALVLVACGSQPSDAPASSAGATAGAGGGSSTLSSSSGSSSSSGAGGAGGTSGSGGGGGAGGAGGGSGGAGGGILGPHSHVTVSVINEDATAGASEPIVVNDASGAIVSMTQTALDGKVGVDVPIGGMVAVYPSQSGDEHHMQAVVDPPDGSTVHFLSYGGKPKANDPKTTFHVTTTGYPAATTTLAIRDCNDGVDVPVSPGGTTLVDITDAGCFGAPKNRIMVVASDASKAAIAWGVASDLPESPGNVVPVAISVDQLAFKTFTDTIAPIDASATGATLWMTVADSEPIELWTMQSNMAPSPSASWSFTLPDFPLGMWVAESVAFQVGAHVHAAGRQQIYPSLPASTIFNPTALATLDLDPLDLSDPLHPRLTWTAGAGPVGDALFVSIYAGGGKDAIFDVTAPSGGAALFRLPDVPAALLDYSPAVMMNNTPTTWKAGVSFMDQLGQSWPGYFIFKGVTPGIGDVVTSSTGGLP